MLSAFHRRRGGGGVGEDIQSPTCLNWLQIGFCALVAMETEGREHHEGEMAGKATGWIKVHSCAHSVGVFAFALIEGYLRVNIR